MNTTQMYDYWKVAKPTETFEQFSQSIKLDDWPALYEGLIYESISFEDYCGNQYFEYANQLWHSETYCITPEGTISFDICSCAHCSCSHLISKP